MLIFIPQIIKSLGVTSNMTVGWLTMVPYICAAFALLGWGWLSDRMNERRWNLFWACVVSTAGLVMAGMTMGTWWALVGMSIAACGFYGSKGPFWAMPPMFLTGPAAAAAIHRQPGGILWPLVCGFHEGCHRQLRRRPLRAGGIRDRLGDDLRVLAQHPEQCGNDTGSTSRLGGALTAFVFIYAVAQRRRGCGPVGFVNSMAAAIVSFVPVYAQSAA
jgi:nitrate/nitrite transporter NarK